MDVTLEEGYLNITHPELGMAPLAVRDRQIFNYKRMDMPLIQLKRQGGCRKKHPEQPKEHTDEKRDWKKGFGRLEIEEDI